MTTVYALVFVILLPLFSSVTLANPFDDIFAPIVSPVLGELCKEVGCGKGKCKMSEKNDLKYECECDPGWMQTIFPNVSSVPKFLPCVIPNCTLNHSCSEIGAAAPAAAEPGHSFSNASLFEPCGWANCGGGVCKKKSGLTYSCECNQGYSNLLNNTGFPCFKECSFEGNCSNLGLSLSNTSTLPSPPSPSLADSGTNNLGTSLRHEALFNGVIVLVIAVAPLLYIF